MAARRMQASELPRMQGSMEEEQMGAEELAMFKRCK
jgi:hypothetical protein